MEIILAIATILGGASAVWFFWDKARTKKLKADQLLPPSLPKPDIRVKANIRLVPDIYNDVQKILNITIENHSSSPLFMGNIELKLRDGQLFFVPKDFLTGEFQTRRILHPGESFSFHILPDVIARKVNPKDLICAIVKDDIHRVYESSESDFQLAMRVLFADKDGAPTAAYNHG
jgi:hypothetical protein